MVLDTNLIIYGQRTWCILDLKGKITKTNFFVGDGEIHFIKMLETLDSYSMIRLGEIQLKKHLLNTSYSLLFTCHLSTRDPGLMIYIRLGQYFILITFCLTVVNAM